MQLPMAASCSARLPPRRDRPCRIGNPVTSPSEGMASVRHLTGEAQQSIRMTADRVLVVPPAELGERRSRGGILIPATAESEAKRAIWAEVVAVGPLVRSAEPEDHVLFAPETA